MNEPPLFTVQPGPGPLVISFPHVGTHIPQAHRHRYTERALQVEDTDWFLDRLYAFAAGLGATLLVPSTSRYWIDLNRGSDNAPMYPGRNNTELCPTRHFTGHALYREGQEPDAAEVRSRVASHWQPYHDALATLVAQAKARHGHAVLFDAHSIKSELPWLFEGTLPHLNLGTASGSACAGPLRQALATVLARHGSFSHVVDGRFKGGHITRHFGRPAEQVHTVQLEMCWRTYMDETPPYRWHAGKAAAATPLLRELVQTMLQWRPAA
jgi:N-formylglutamate deformylase